MIVASREQALVHLEAVEAFLRQTPPVVIPAPSLAIPEPPAPAPPPGAGLQDPAAFWAAMRKTNILGPVLSPEEVTGTEYTLASMAGRFPLSWAAYTLATEYHETAGTMAPILERGGPSYFHRMYDIRGSRPAKARELGNLAPGDGVKYAGRGEIQTTGKTNYIRAQTELAKVGIIVDLVNHPEHILRQDASTMAMILGMRDGWYTGKALRDFIPAKAARQHYINARRIVNGTDRAEDIADIALVFQRALEAGQWL